MKIDLRFDSLRGALTASSGLEVAKSLYIFWDGKDWHLSDWREMQQWGEPPIHLCLRPERDPKSPEPWLDEMEEANR